MAPKTKARRRRRTREPLVHQHLENVSRDLLEKHPELVREFVGRNAGVYALFRRGKLYYVGLATALRSRLKAHVRNRHSNSWDSFSIYLTIKDQHLRERLKRFCCVLPNHPVLDSAASLRSLRTCEGALRRPSAENNTAKFRLSSAGERHPQRSTLFKAVKAS